MALIIIDDTNMQRGNQLPPPCSHLVERILLLFDPGADPADIAGVSRSYAFELRLDDKTVARAPVLRAPAVGTLDYLMGPADGRFPSRLQRKPVRLPNEVAWHLARPVELLPLQHFQLFLARASGA